MNAFVGVTDSDWFDLLSSQPGIEEVNFWQPGGKHLFKAIAQGELFLFKAHRRNIIIGGGVFVHATLLPVGLAWTTFGTGNGATSLQGMRRQIEKYRKQPGLPHEDYTIGCIVLVQPFFFTQGDYVAAPHDWPTNVPGRKYDLTQEPGLSIYRAVTERLQALRWASITPTVAAEPAARYGIPMLIQPRLGQGAFRIVVTDAYERRCAISGERVLPVLEAAHVRPYADGGLHQVDNGLLLRSDLHTLFDRGYITVTPEHHVEVSKRIREEFENGREYYVLHGSMIRDPKAGLPQLSAENLRWHNEQRFLG
jgi:putative restriction endonuclease